AVSSARPKVADYPFTTLNPSLGVVRVESDASFVVADIPGLIEGAAEGAGLGHQFLRHLSRTRLLLHLVDLAPPGGEGNPVDADTVRDIRALANELKKYDASLHKKPRWLVFNKADLLPAAEAAARAQHVLRALRWKKPWFLISAINGKGCPQLSGQVYAFLTRNAKPGDRR